MTTEDRATAFVRRADEALGDLDRSEELWTASIRSKTEEIRLHSLSLELDNLIRRAKGPFQTWADLDASQVEAVRERGPVNLMWVISAHPSGHVREAFVHQSDHLDDDRILPHLANRAIDFVPQVRELAGPKIIARFGEVSAEFAGPDRPEKLPTAAHIAVTKLLAPRTGMISPGLLHTCIDLATTSDMALPRRFRSGGLARMIDRCDQTLAASSDAESSAAIEALIVYFQEQHKRFIAAGHG